ncbi:hypothetical protein [Vulcanisaeta distributa]|uniref:Uncharacterized protein n=1 Tax=Vulcanisaeta distributa (strain DSM 14429 / JCM 11212 / NBRC 100878 / IC-017) TaxID=572478 RepID=E1QRQ1_VULDI|nr:hypothetical protein [Vulcanisaeta distributa]ADN49426.1 hypothetical protein Vdis_0011 [Vulcanisaeta distributa DSM 14429]
MSIEDARTKLMALKDVLNHIEGINKAMDELPKLLITVLGIVAMVLGGYIAYIIIYVLTARSMAPQLQSWGVIIISILLIAIPYYVYTRIDKLMRGVSTYDYWVGKLQSGISGILEVLSTLDFDGIEYKINRARAGYALLIIVKLLALSILLAILIFGLTLLLLSFLGYTQLNWYVIAMTVILDIAITLALEWDSITNDVKKLWSLGGLIIELRWLYHELKGIQA